MAARSAELLTVTEVLAELGGISRRTFYRWRELGLAPHCIRLPNGELRVRRAVLNAWLDERAEGAA
ncbi:helix-turn-helix transcriptional regulator [Streptomyces sp. CA-111067]|uniref:helix-turn-helix transcriptional regulator n=1 Tax=Streptomyces sp. CA-111067 TaxID=3240046 RepID=UPI003D9799F1